MSVGVRSHNHFAAKANLVEQTTPNDHNAFLWEKIHEDVYISQPPGNEKANHPEFFFHLKKAFYELR